MVEKVLNGVTYTDTNGAAEILECSVASVHRLVRAEKAAEKKAKAARRHYESRGIPFYQAGENTALLFPVPGLHEFIRMRTRGIAFNPQEA